MDKSGTMHNIIGDYTQHKRLRTKEIRRIRRRYTERERGGGRRYTEREREGGRREKGGEREKKTLETIMDEDSRAKEEIGEGRAENVGLVRAGRRRGDWGW